MRFPHGTAPRWAGPGGAIPARLGCGGCGMFWQPECLPRARVLQPLLVRVGRMQPPGMLGGQGALGSRWHTVVVGHA